MTGERRPPPTPLWPWWLRRPPVCLRAAAVRPLANTQTSRGRSAPSHASSRRVPPPPPCSTHLWQWRCAGDATRVGVGRLDARWTNPRRTPATAAARRPPAARGGGKQTSQRRRARNAHTIAACLASVPPPGGGPARPPALVRRRQMAGKQRKRGTPQPLATKRGPFPWPPSSLFMPTHRTLGARSAHGNRHAHAYTTHTQLRRGGAPAAGRRGKI